jgi:hypothetical protein
MSKRIPIYLSQDDLETIYHLLNMNKTRSLTFTLPPKQANLHQRIEEQLTTFEDYENGIRKLEK